MAITGEAPAEEAGGIVAIMTFWLCTMVCVTVVAMTRLRKWMDAHDLRNRAAIDQIARERSAFVEASATRIAELNAREERINQQAEVNSKHLLSLATRLDEALTSNNEFQRRLAALQEDYTDLATEYNRVVQDTLQERAARFTRQPATSADSPVRPYADEHQGHADVTPLPLRLPPARHSPEGTRHDRTKEGVGGPA